MNFKVKMARLAWVLPLLMAGCSAGLEGWTELPAYAQAKGTKTYNLKEDRARQISYEVEAEYPDLAVVDFYLEQIGAPWVPCFSEAEWTRLINDDDKKVITVHEVRLHWVNFELDRLILLGVWYESKGEQAVEVPDNTEQKVDLVEYQDANVQEVVERLGLECEGAG